MPEKVKLTRTDVPTSAEAGQTVSVTGTIDVILWVDVSLRAWLNVYVKETGTGIIYWSDILRLGIAATKTGTFAMPGQGITVVFEAYYHNGTDWILDHVVEVPVALGAPPPEEVGTRLTMAPSKTNPIEGEAMSFTGRLTRNDTGAGVPGQLIYILDKDLIWDDQIGSGYTDANGNYSIGWMARPMDPWPDKTVEAFAHFEGGTVGVTTANPSSSPERLITISVPVAVNTTLSIRASKINPIEGEIVTFTGKLTRVDTRAGVPDQLITILDWDIAYADVMASGYTDSAGNYSIEWSARPMDPLDKTIEAYAMFEGAEAILNPSNSPQTVITISVVPVVAVTVNVDDATTGGPIENGKVAMAGLTQYTDAGGTTTFESLAGDKTYTLQVSKEGYIAKSATVAVGTADETVNVSLTFGVTECTIATAAYGSRMHGDILTLKKFRDEELPEWFVNLYEWPYYVVSPPIARYISKHEKMRHAVRIWLKPLILCLRMLTR